MSCLALALFCSSLSAVAELIPIISPTNVWKYNDESIDLGTNWIAPGYNDSAWSNSPTAIGFRALNNGVYPLPPPNVLRSTNHHSFVTNYCTTNSIYPSGFCSTSYGTVATNTSPIVTNITFSIGSIIRKNTPTNVTQNIMTFYFRTHVVLQSNLSGAILTASNLIDDGAIFYINGRELERVRMPEGPVNWSTPALSTFLIGTSRTPGPNSYGYAVFSVPVDLLVPGDNVVAVEVHQGSTANASMAFQMELWAEYFAPTFLSITNQPSDIVVEEGNPATLTLGVSGDGAHYQWYRQGTGAIPGAIAERYTFYSTTPTDSGLYYAVASNSVNVVTSRIASVTVFLDTNAPAIFDASGATSQTNVLVSFSEPVLASTATNLANYKITNTLGGTQAVIRAVMVGSTNVLLTATNARIPNNNYLLIVNGVRDTSPRQNLIIANSRFPISNLATNLIGLGSGGWRFYDPYPPFDAPNLGTAWKEADYVETNAWSDGSGIFYNGINPVLPGPGGTQLSQTPTVTSYYRYNLSGFQFSPGRQRFLLTHVVDDGAIIYLNGQEVLRTNMLAGTPTYQTAASATVGNPPRIGPIPLTNEFRAGGNVIAVELHQIVSGDTDKIFGLQLDGYVRSVPIGPVMVVGGPSDITAVEGQTATFEVVQVGGTSFQWRQGGVNVGGNSPAYTTPPVTMAMNNAQFSVVVNGITSTNARLKVVADTGAPSLLAGYANANSITLSFSEPVSVASATAVGNYAVTNGAGQTFAVTGASVSDGTNVVLSFASLPPNVYFVVVNNVRDASVAGNLIAPNSAVRTGFDAAVLTFASTWRYDQSGVNLAAQGWTNRTYNDAGWPSGPGLLDGKAGGRAAATLPLPVGTVLLAPTNGPGGRYLTNVYFRAHFNSYASGPGTITFNTALDDGAVIYLNGVELNRIRMPAAPTVIAYTTFASTSVGDATVEGPFTFAVSNLVAGDNVIAAEVHQNGTGSTDVTWGGEFSLFIPSSVLPTNQPPTCTPTAVASPLLQFGRSNGTNVVLSWTNPTTNTCGDRAVFTLQQALTIANPPSATVWNNVTTTSPYTAIGTNVARFFRLRR